MRYLLPFLVLLALLVALFTYFTCPLCRTHLEEDLQASAQKALDEGGYEDVAVSFDRHFATLTGDGSRQEAAAQLVADLPGTRLAEPNQDALEPDSSEVAQSPPEDTPSADPLPPQSATVSIHQTAAGINLTGQLPDTATKQTIIDAIRAAHPTMNINDDQVILDPNTKALASPRDLPNFVTHYLDTVDRGQLQVRDDGLILEGQVSDLETKTALGNQAGAILEDDSLVINELTIQPAQLPVMAEPADEPEVALQTAFKKGAIYFDSGQKTIKDEDIPTLKELSETLKASPDLKLFVGGYADKSGNPEANRRLSLQRATAVYEQLVGFGVNPDRLTVESFGDEGTQDELWKSRRVELSIQQ